MKHQEMRRAVPRFIQNILSFEIKPALVIVWQAALTLKLLLGHAAHFPVNSQRMVAAKDL